MLNKRRLCNRPAWLLWLGILATAVPGCIDNDTPLVARHRAMLAERRGDYETAIKIRDELIQKFPDYYYQSEVYFEQGMTHFDQGQHEQALELFNRAIEADPEFLQAFIRRCQVNALLGNHAQSIADGNRALDLSIEDRNMALAFLHQGNSQAAMQQNAKARVNWQLSLILDADQLPALNQLVAVHMEEANLDEALQLIEASLQRNDRVARKHVLHSQVLLALNRREEAEAALNRARELDTEGNEHVPASLDELAVVPALETAPMVHVAARPVYDDQPTPAAFTRALEIATRYLREKGIEASALPNLPPNLLRCKDAQREFDVLIKLLPTDQADSLPLSQRDLELVTESNPPRGMLVISELKTDPVSGDTLPNSGRVVAFTPSWRPDPFRLTATEFEYRLPTPEAVE